MKKIVLGIDPGLAGFFVLTDGDKFVRTWAMPIHEISIKNKTEKRVSFSGVSKILRTIEKVFDKMPVFLERAKPMAMGSNFAFKYGMDYQKILIALEIQEWDVTLVEPSEWTKAMHEGISADLKPKAKSLIAAERYPHLVKVLPRKPRGAIHDGSVDALLIAAWGLTRFQLDFF